MLSVQSVLRTRIAARQLVFASTTVLVLALGGCQEVIPYDGDGNVERQQPPVALDGIVLPPPEEEPEEEELDPGTCPLVVAGNGVTFDCRVLAEAEGFCDAIFADVNQPNYQLLAACGTCDASYFQIPEGADELCVHVATGGGTGDPPPPPLGADPLPGAPPATQEPVPGEPGWREVALAPLSTFAADVDTASYSLARRDLLLGQLPDPSRVRIEEFLNYFRSDDEAPTLDSPDPFAVALEAAPSFFGEGKTLLRIGVQAAEVPLEERDPVNLVFLIDVSGSMAGTGRLDLVKFTLGQLVDKLAPTDTLGIVTYAGAEQILLAPTAVVNKSAILDAISALGPGGSTAGEAGIVAAYDLAESALRDDGVNRVVLCTDGDFNVGATGDELVALIEDFRDRGIFLSIFGYGAGNYQDTLMEELSNHGNGNYAFIDSPNEALRVTGEKLVSTLQVVAKDVKLQVEFNPATVSRYRLLGYDNRLLDDEDFTDDTIDAGDLGAGHHVTALYELELTEAATAGDALPLSALGSALAEVRVRHKKPEGDVSVEQVVDLDLSARIDDFTATSRDLQWAAATAELAEILAGAADSEGARFDDVLDVLQGNLGPEPEPAELELLLLVGQARDLWPAGG